MCVCVTDTHISGATKKKIEIELLRYGLWREHNDLCVARHTQFGIFRHNYYQVKTHLEKRI